MSIQTCNSFSIDRMRSLIRSNISDLNSLSRQPANSKEPILGMRKNDWNGSQNTPCPVTSRRHNCKGGYECTRYLVNMSYPLKARRSHRRLPPQAVHQTGGIALLLGGGGDSVVDIHKVVCRFTELLSQVPHIISYVSKVACGGREWWRLANSRNKPENKWELSN